MRIRPNTLRGASGIVTGAGRSGELLQRQIFQMPVSYTHLMAIYTTTTMFGAFLGRIGSGFITSWLGWQAAFLTYALLLGFALPCLLLLQRTRSTQHDVFSPAHLLGVLRQPGLLLLMLIGPLCIFAHASVLNLAPFRMRELLPDAGSWATGLLYVPAFICSLLGIFSKKIIRLLHGEMRTIRCGVLLFLASVPSLLLSLIHI